MKIAVTYENGQIFGHFGHTENFKIYTVEDGKVVSSVILPTLGSGHGALAGFLLANRVDVLICGGIGGGARMALQEAGIALYGGCMGYADTAVEDLLSGNLSYNPNVQCNHHDHGEDHNCADHHCGGSATDYFPQYRIQKPRQALVLPRFFQLSERKICDILSKTLTWRDAWIFITTHSSPTVIILWT
jgi:predicted Fe-Mo cluster-binding NifX family protein